MADEFIHQAEDASVVFPAHVDVLHVSHVSSDSCRLHSNLDVLHRDTTKWDSARLKRRSHLIHSPAARQERRQQMHCSAVHAPIF